jgi:hypothetical protein
MSTRDNDCNVEISSIGQHDWERVAREFDNANIYQTSSYGSVVWESGKLEYLVVREHGKIIAGAQILVRRVRPLRMGIAYISWGPLYRSGVGAGKYFNLRLILKALRERYVAEQNCLLLLNFNGLRGADDEAIEVFREEKYIWFSRKRVYTTFLCDLMRQKEEVRSGFSQKWRNQLNRAERNRLTVVQGEDEQLFLKHFDLYNQLVSRKRFLPGIDPRKYLEIQKRLPDDLKMRVFICEHEGRHVASSVCSAIGDRGIYLMGATNSVGLREKASYLLQWKMIEWMMQKKVKWYDLGGANSKRNPGVYHFKAGLSQLESTHLGYFESWGSIRSCILSALYWGFSSIFKWGRSLFRFMKAGY